MKIDYSLILSMLAVQLGPLILAVLGVGALIVALMVTLLGSERVLSLVSGQEAKFARRYERERRRERSKRAQRSKRVDAGYEAYRVRRERRTANRVW